VKRIIAALAIALSVVQTARAQDAPMVLTPAERAKVAGRELSGVVDPTRATVGVPQPIFTVDASTSGSEAAAAVGYQYGDFTFDGKVSGPVNSSGEAIFADLDGMHNQTSIDLGAQFLRWQVRDPAPILLPACRDLAKITGVDVKKLDCSLSNLRKEAKDRNLPLLVPYIDPGTVFLFGARYKVSRQGFDWVSPSDLSEHSDAHTNWSFAAGLSIITRQNLLLGGGYRRQVTWVPGSPEVSLCLPLGVDTATYCSDAVLGAPRERNANLMYAELRKFLGPIALSPRFTRDFSNDVTGIEVPVYFLKNVDGGFTGGVRVGWRSDRKGLAVVGFVGRVLGILTVP